jgi:hypothetical protein
LHRQEAPITVTKHSHGLYHSQCFHRIVSHMLLEVQFVIKIEAQIPPIGFGFQGVALSVRLIAKIERRVIISGLPGEVKQFRFVML